MNYTVADIAVGFACKCGQCRRNCCGGWPVTISRQEYERIRQAECPEEYREKLREALHLNFAPDDTRYAHIVHDRQGKCILLTEEGLCSLQLQLGEEILPAVCRLYPRNRREVCSVPECALSFSCEAVTERLLASREPLRFTRLEIGEAPLFPIDMREDRYARCQRALEHMADRSRPIADRFALLGRELFPGLGAEGEESTPADAVRLLHQLAVASSGKTKVAGRLCMEALSFFGFPGKDRLSGREAEDLSRRYTEAASRLFGSVPGLEDYEERLLVNHMFYNNFPHVGGTDDGERAFYSLCTIFGFVKFILAGNLNRIGSREDAADVISELGRLIEHSEFKYIAAQYYRKQADFSPRCWEALTRM